MQIKHAAFGFALSLCFIAGCAGAPIESTPQSSTTGNTPTPADDAAILNAWLAASRGAAAGNRAGEAEAMRPKSGEKNAVKLVQWAVAQPDRQAGWRTCLDLKSRQAKGTLNAFSPWPFVCRAMLLAEQRMFDQSKRMLSASNIKLASIEVSFIMGHLQKKRFDKVRKHLEQARQIMPNHPMLDLLSSSVATDKAEELKFLEAFYAKDKRHFGVLKRLAQFYDEAGNPLATDLLLAAANINPKNTDMRVMLAGRFKKEGKINEAREQYQAIVKAVPHHEGALNFLVSDAAQRGDHKLELSYVHALIKELKDTRPRRVREAQLLAKTNQIDLAEAAYKKLLRSRTKKLPEGHLFLAKVLLSRGKPFKAITHLMEAGDAGKPEMAALAEQYEVGTKLPTNTKSINPVIWRAEALLKKRFKAARKRAPLAKAGRISFDLTFDEEGRCSEVAHSSKRVNDNWFLVGAYLLQYGMAHKSVAGGEISWELSLP